MTGLFSAWRNWRERRSAMQELRSFQVVEREWDHFKVADIMTEAVTALKRDDYRHAAALWEKAIAHNRQEAESSEFGLEVLLKLRRYDEAERMMLKWQQRKPADPQYSLGLAKVAAAKGDHGAAVRYAAAFRKRFPAIMWGYATGISALRDARRLQEAEALAEQGMRLFPGEVLMFIEHARIATEQGDWNTSLERWENCPRQIQSRERLHRRR